jgi:Flp pilus assembly pilin Flp
MIIKFLKDESGQASVEYVLFLVMLMSIVITVGRNVMVRFQDLVTNRIGGSLTRGFFRPEAMYRFNLF